LVVTGAGSRRAGEEAGELEGIDENGFFHVGSIEERFLSAQADHSFRNEWEENIGLLRSE
jgi:hypothetical protein